MPNLSTDNDKPDDELTQDEINARNNKILMNVRLSENGMLKTNEFNDHVKNHLVLELGYVLQKTHEKDMAKYAESTDHFKKMKEFIRECKKDETINTSRTQWVIQMNKNSYGNEMYKDQKGCSSFDFILAALHAKSKLIPTKEIGQITLSLLTHEVYVGVGCEHALPFFLTVVLGGGDATTYYFIQECFMIMLPLIAQVLRKFEYPLRIDPSINLNDDDDDKKPIITPNTSPETIPLSPVDVLAQEQQSEPDNTEETIELSPVDILAHQDEETLTSSTEIALDSSESSSSAPSSEISISLPESKITRCYYHDDDPLNVIIEEHSYNEDGLLNVTVVETP